MLAAVHAVPLVVQSAAPLVLKSLPPVKMGAGPATGLPVNVTNWPQPDLVVWITMGVAIATLFGVGYQIWLSYRALVLANDELAATNKTLDLARKELEATNSALAVTQESNALVEESLRYAREQSAHIARKAELHLFSNALMRGAPLPPPAPDAANNARLTFYVANYLTSQQGKSAQSASIQILFPPGLSLFAYPGLSQPSDLALTALPDWYDGTTSWKQYEGHLQQTFFPGTLQSAFSLLVRHTAELSGGILWRLLYDDGVTPSGGSYTALTTLDALDRSRLVAGIPPPVN